MKSKKKSWKYWENTPPPKNPQHSELICFNGRISTTEWYCHVCNAHNYEEGGGRMPPPKPASGWKPKTTPPYEERKLKIKEYTSPPDLSSGRSKTLNWVFEVTELYLGTTGDVSIVSPFGTVSRYYYTCTHTHLKHVLWGRSLGLWQWRDIVGSISHLVEGLESRV